VVTACTRATVLHAVDVQSVLMSVLSSFVTVAAAGWLLIPVRAHCRECAGHLIDAGRRLEQRGAESDSRKQALRLRGDRHIAVLNRQLCDAHLVGGRKALERRRGRKLLLYGSIRRQHQSLRRRTPVSADRLELICAKVRTPMAATGDRSVGVVGTGAASTVTCVFVPSWSKLKKN